MVPKITNRTRRTDIKTGCAAEQDRYRNIGGRSYDPFVKAKSQRFFLFFGCMPCHATGLVGKAASQPIALRTLVLIWSLSTACANSKGMYDGGAYNRRQGSIPVRFGQIPLDPRIWAGIDAEPVAERLAYLFSRDPFSPFGSSSGRYLQCYKSATAQLTQLVVVLKTSSTQLT